MTDDRATRARSLVLVALILASVFAPTLVAVAPAAAASSTSSAPSGMVGVPSSNLDDIRPSDVERSITASDLDGAVYVSEHASTTEVSIVTRAQAAKVARGASPADVANERVCSSPASTPFNCERDTTTSLVISDDVHDEGRRVAIDVDVVRDALGYVPEHVAVANNETGETWRAPATVKNGYLIADLAHFSSNSVSFEGTVNVTATPATNSTTIQYNLSDLSAASDPVINMTGRAGTETETPSSTGRYSWTFNPNVAGNAEPTGPASGDPELSVTGKAKTITSWSGNANPPIQTQTEMKSIASGQVAIEEENSGTGDGNSWSVDWELRRVSDGTILESGTATLTDETTYTDNVVISLTGGHTFSKQDVEFEVMTNTNNAREDGGSSSITTQKASSADITINGATTTLTSIESTQTMAADIQPGDTIGVSATYGKVQTKLNVTERSKTSDPALILNGNKTGYTGTLNDSETVTLSANSSDLQEGTNYVNASVGDGTLSSDAPAPVFDFTYEHDAKSTYKVDYSAEKLTVRYEVGKNYSSDQSDVTMKVPFEKNVLEMRDVEKQTNGNGWTSVSASNYRIDSGTLYVDVGDVKSGDVVEVRANGSRVRTYNMTIEVVEPTAPGDELDSKIKIKSIGSDASMTVSASGTTEFVRYTSKESWSNPKAKIRVGSDGKQTLYLPNAGAGSTFRLNDHSTKVKVETNEVELRFEDSGVEPKIRVMPGPHEGDPVTFVYTQTTSGETYVLYSLTHEIQRDSDEASSPAYLKDDDSLETLEIFEDDSSTSTVPPDDGSTTSSVIAGAKESAPDLPPFGYLLLAIAVTIGVYYLTQRTPGEGRILLYVIVPPVWAVALELVGIPIISLPVEAAAGGLGRVFPALALLFGGVAAYGIYVRYIKDAAKPDSVTNVSFNLRGKKK